jgi:hypothetical protein
MDNMSWSKKAPMMNAEKINISSYLCCLVWKKCQPKINKVTTTPSQGKPCAAPITQASQAN